MAFMAEVAADTVADPAAPIACAGHILSGVLHLLYAATSTNSTDILALASTSAESG